MDTSPTIFLPSGTEKCWPRLDLEVSPSPLHQSVCNISHWIELNCLSLQTPEAFRFCSRKRDDTKRKSNDDIVSRKSCLISLRDRVCSCCFFSLFRRSSDSSIRWQDVYDSLFWRLLFAVRNWTKVGVRSCSKHTSKKLMSSFAFPIFKSNYI